MSRLMWNDAGQRFYETGIDRGVLYPNGADGVAWNGLTSVAVHPSGGSARSYYMDGVKYLNIPSSEEYVATIKAYTYPDEFAQCDGTTRVHSGLFITQQARKSFGFSYRTKVGTDLDGDSGYKIHIVYNALAEPSDKTYNSIGDSIEPIDFSWEITTLPPEMTGYKRSAHLEIDTRSSNPSALLDVENILYGTEENEARLPTLTELIEVFDVYAILSVTDHGDGTFTVSGPDEAIVMLDASTFEITWPSATPIDADTFSISSL